MNENNNQNLNSKLNFSNYGDIPTREEYQKNQMNNNLNQPNQELNQNMNSQFEQPKTLSEGLTNSYNQMNQGLNQTNPLETNPINQDSFNQNQEIPSLVNNQPNQELNQNMNPQFEQPKTLSEGLTNSYNQMNQGLNQTNPLEANSINQDSFNQNQINPNQEIPSLPNNQPENNVSYNVEEEFAMPKKKPIGLIITIILFLLLGGFATFYYFILDNPKTIINHSVNKISKTVMNIDLENIANLEKLNQEYDINYKILTSDESLKQTYDILNNITLNMTLGLDKKSEKLSLILNPKYKEKEIVNMHILGEMTDNGKLYIKLNDLYDKVIYMESTEENNQEEETIPTVSINDYKKLISKVLDIFKENLETATYKKEYLKLNEKYTKKVSLIIDAEFMKSFYNKLINDQEYLDTSSKITGDSKETIIDNLNKEINELDSSENTIYSIYLSPLSNKLIMLEIVTKDDSLKITEENNQYNYELKEKDKILYQGYFKYENNSNVSTIKTSLDSLEDKLSIEFNINITNNKDKGLDELDITDSINIDEIPEADLSNILLKLLEKESIKLFLKDTGLDTFLTMMSPSV